VQTGQPDSRAGQTDSRGRTSSHTAEGIDSSSAVKAVGDEFQLLIEPLETAADRVLDGVNRQKAFQAWQTCPRGFEVVVRRAFKQATRNPVGLMLWMLDRRHHEAAERAIERSHLEEPNAEGRCFVCSEVGPVFAYAGQWFCERHRDEQHAFDGGVAL
jgi:hypothetical protein